MFNPYETKEQMRERIEGLFKQLERKKAIERILAIEDWKFENCYRIDDSLCEECCSGGSLVGAFCDVLSEQIKESDLEI